MSVVRAFRELLELFGFVIGWLILLWSIGAMAGVMAVGFRMVAG